MRTPEGDQLLGVIRDLVHGRVHPSQEEATVEIVAQTVILIMSDPQYYSHLRLVIELQSRIVQLERAIAMYQQNMVRGSSSAPSTRPKKAAARKGPAKPRPTKKPSRSYNVKEFRKGLGGR
jgi:hypothetical protein